jgi:hypothetical protein
MEVFVNKKLSIHSLFNEELTKESTKYFILDSNGTDHTEDIDFEIYIWEKSKFNKLSVGDLFLYRRPRRGSKFKDFYFFGGGKIEKIIDIADESKAIISKSFAFVDFLFPDDLRDFKWQFREKKSENWSNFFNQYGMNEVNREDFLGIIELVEQNDLTFIDSTEDEVDLNQVQSYNEGRRKQEIITRRERNPKAREAALAYHGRRCKVCDMSFEDVYGQLGKGFIHVHHVTPLSEVIDVYSISPQEDLVPVCPNCHAMLHRKDREGNYKSIEELSTIYNEREKKNSKSR